MAGDAAVPGLDLAPAARASSNAVLDSLEICSREEVSSSTRHGFVFGRQLEGEESVDPRYPPVSSRFT